MASTNLRTRLGEDAYRAYREHMRELARRPRPRRKPQPSPAEATETIDAAERSNAG